jgi:hypothetical protein
LGITSLLVKLARKKLIRPGLEAATRIADHNGRVTGLLLASFLEQRGRAVAPLERRVSPATSFATRAQSPSGIPAKYLGFL